MNCATLCEKSRRGQPPALSSLLPSPSLKLPSESSFELNLTPPSQIPSTHSVFLSVYRIPSSPLPSWYTSLLGAAAGPCPRSLDSFATAVWPFISSSSPPPPLVVSPSVDRQGPASELAQYLAAQYLAAQYLAAQYLAVQYFAAQPSGRRARCRRHSSLPSISSRPFAQDLSGILSSPQVSQALKPTAQDPQPAKLAVQMTPSTPQLEVVDVAATSVGYCQAAQARKAQVSPALNLKTIKPKSSSQVPQSLKFQDASNPQDSSRPRWETTQESQGSKISSFKILKPSPDSRPQDIKIQDLGQDCRLLQDLSGRLLKPQDAARPQDSRRRKTSSFEPPQDLSGKLLKTQNSNFSGRLLKEVQAAVRPQWETAQYPRVKMPKPQLGDCSRFKMREDLGGKLFKSLSSLATCYKFKTTMASRKPGVCALMPKTGGTKTKILEKGARGGKDIDIVRGTDPGPAVPE
ncbi:hypothetical protein C8F04DRAFT_1226750 [Mycena alexandri]|uniref:Uncharacterized protein n=1 Tax=Mycena alexandri TaxID=1745969 RepID=A0AAD6TPC1_9AGAR|nr:hypothetical protein C8F04DRAFT_1226750 [Mycena alexandri]